MVNETPQNNEHDAQLEDSALVNALLMGGAVLTGVGKGLYWYSLAGPGYTSPDTPLTTEKSYARDDIEQRLHKLVDFVASDPKIQAEKDRVLTLLADNVETLPPWQQVLILEGNRKIHIGTQAEVNKVNGSVHILGQFNRKNDQVSLQHRGVEYGWPKPFMDREFKETFNHEYGHSFDWNMRSFKLLYSSLNLKWSEALEKELNHQEMLKEADPHFEQTLKAGGLLSHLKGSGTSSMYRYLNLEESAAQLTAIFNAEYQHAHGDWVETNTRMMESYPHLWPVYRDEFIPKLLVAASAVNPHIDSSLPGMEPSVKTTFPRLPKLGATINGAATALMAVPEIVDVAHDLYNGQPATAAKKTGHFVDAAIAGGACAGEAAEVSLPLLAAGPFGGMAYAGAVVSAGALCSISTEMGLNLAEKMLGKLTAPQTPTANNIELPGANISK